MKNGGILVDLEKKIQKFYGETRADKIDELKRVYDKNKNKKKNRGYLICNTCSGYYKLKENESPEDFNRCECGSPLEYVENIDHIRKTGISSSSSKSKSKYSNSDYEFAIDELKDEYYDEYRELQQIVDIIGINAEERMKFLEKLYENVQKQEMILNNIDQRKIIEVRDNEWSLWGLIEENNIKNDIYKEKMVMEDIIERENRLLSYIKEKRKHKPLIKKSINGYGKLIIITLIIAFIGIITIYVLK